MKTVRAVRSDVTDDALMRRVQADDQDAFQALYDRFGARAYGVAASIVRDRARAEDLVEEAFLSVWRWRARYRPGHATAGSWVLGLVRERAVDSLRRSRREDLAVDGLSEDRDAQLHDALARLPAAQRDVISLAYFGELSTTEIANELALPVGTIRGRMRLGLEKLRDEP